VVPAPGPGEFVLEPGATLIVESRDPAAVGVAHQLAGWLRPASGYPLPVLASAGGEAPAGSLVLALHPGQQAGEEGYSLAIGPEGVALSAAQPAGLFYAAQTLRQLFPPAIERSAVQPGPWTLPAVAIVDRPRFAWRGFMLDVARHFFTPADVRRLIDYAALYKLNRFHLGLANDQGWRLEIRSWPRLAAYGGSTEIGGGPGGYYTQSEYAELAAYAAERFITLVPEIDAPGHTNAALASYAELNLSGEAPPLYTGIEVGFSSLCIHKEITYRFLSDVIAEVAALTPGPYIHIGGDEAHSTSPDDYVYFIERAEAIIRAHGKQMVGWEEVARCRLQPGSLVQQWKSAPSGPVGIRDLQAAGAQGARIIASPGGRAYLDMKYTADSPLGLQWAGLVEVRDAYDWDPLSEYPALAEGDLAGVEAALWSETLRSLADAEYLAFPRLPGLAEIAWSPREGRSWEEYRLRLAAHAPRFDAMGINYYRSPQVPWPGETL